jgi:4-amino-4-deoxy-L-arabinose transferase-like glycosyltransferase
MVAAAVRVAALQPALPPTPLLGDEYYYARVAVNLAVGRGHVYQESVVLQPSGRMLLRSEKLVALRPPAYPWLLSHWIDTRRHGRPLNLEDSRMALLAVQVALGTALVGLTAWLGSALFGARTGWLAGAVAALYPTLIAHSHYLWSENFFAVTITAALIGVVYGEKRRSLLGAAITGTVFGVAALTREVAIPIAAACALWGLWMAPSGARRAALGRGALLLALAFSVVLPWTLRNDRALHRFVPVATIGWFAAAEGNSLDDPDWLHSRVERRRFKASYLTLRGELERMDFAREQTLEKVRAEQPTWIFKKLVRNLALLLRPDSLLFYKIERDGYRDPSPAAVRIALVVTVLSYTAVLVGAVVGIAGASGRGRRLLPCLVFASVAAVHVLANATARFRMPWLPLLIVYASYALLHPREVRANLRGPALYAALAVLLFYAGVCIPHFRADAVRLWNQSVESGAGTGLPIAFSSGTRATPTAGTKRQ